MMEILRTEQNERITTIVFDVDYLGVWCYTGGETTDIEIEIDAEHGSIWLTPDQLRQIADIAEGKEINNV